MTRFEPGERVGIWLGTTHASTMVLNPFEPSYHRPNYRPATFIRYMAGEQYAIVHADEWGMTGPRDVRVLVDDLKKIPQS